MEEEIIHLYSDAFDTNIDYSITIGDNICQILEVSESSIKFKIPLECDSGELILNYSENFLNLGFFKILKERMFAFKREAADYPSEKIEIFELDIYSGMSLKYIEIPTDFSLVYSNYILDASTYNNNVVCLINGYNEKIHLLEYNINTEESHIIELNKEYNRVLTNEKGDIFIRERGDNTIYKINALNGEVLKNIPIPESIYILDWVFDEVEQKIILSTREKEGEFGYYGQESTFYKVSVDNGQIETFITPQSYFHIDLSLDGKLFANAINENIVELNKDTFQQNNFSLDYTNLGGGWNLKYLNSTNEFVGTYTEYCPELFCDSYLAVINSSPSLVSEFLWNDYSSQNNFSFYVITKFK